MTLEKSDLCRLPWSKNDNPIAWLEITDICNLRCQGCYRQKLSGHKTLEEIREEIRFFKRWRNPDNVSIAGGEPLLHPQILDIVALVAENGIKPVVLTNASKLTPALLRELKRAGLAGFTLHIDSRQGRPNWEGKSEAEHNELRQHYADMVAAEGGISTIFNSTVYPATFHEIPAVVRWAQANIERVHGLVFITYRVFPTRETIAFDQEGHAVNADQLSYSGRHLEKFTTSLEVYQLIKGCCPEYEPSGYLGGTVRHDSFKWLASVTIGSRHRMYGSIGKKTMELAQFLHHLFRGTYLAYMAQSRVSPFVFLLAPWDRAIGLAARSWLRDLLQHPGRIFTGLRLQTIGIIQAPDALPNGQGDMCDSCPDMTVWNGTLVNSCRMDEYRLFGGMLTVFDQNKAEPQPMPKTVTKTKEPASTPETRDRSAP
jgi:MoaA/NifB/PqqE/SkfB family radical SAM enzyme